MKGWWRSMKPYRTPNRERNVITQTYNDGIVRIYNAEDAADPGHMPEEKLTLKAQLLYAEQRVGISRFYTAQQYHDDVERLVRVQRAGVIANRDIAVTEDGQRYNIAMVQTVEDSFPPSLDLTLTRIK